MSEGPASDSDESDVEAVNLPHIAEAIVETTHHVTEENLLTHPEESAVGVPAEVIESTAAHLPVLAETEAVSHF